MPATITLKNIPDELHLQLKKVAALHGRSLNSELLTGLAAHYNVQAREPVDDTVRRLDAFRASLNARLLDADELDALKNEGRP